MNPLIATWITLPIEARIALVAMIGVMVGALANHCIYRFAWVPRPIGPWSTPDLKASSRKRIDRIPVLGWFALRRETEIHGSRYWIRPMMIEIALGIGIPIFYWFETQTGLLLPQQVRNPANIALYEPWFTTVFVSHVILILLMVTATFIDFDERNIPDQVTIPGTLIALVLGSLSLDFFMPATNVQGALAPIGFQMPALLDEKWLGPQGFWTGIGIWTLWCFALSNRRLILRQGLMKALEYFCASLVRYPGWKFLLMMWLVGSVLIRVVWGIGGLTWIGLLTSLVGLGVGGGVVWAIRIVGSVALRKEAMGFGDVTLMAMIGAFVGWQGAVMSFFLAPIAAIAIVLVCFAITRDQELPFGPYLCAGTLLTIIWWDRLVNGWFLGNLAILGPFMLWLFIALMGIMGVMLYVWRITKETFLGE